MSTAVEVAGPTLAVQPKSSTRRLRWLLVWIIVLLLSVECMTRLLHNHRKITLNMESGIHEAIAIRPVPDRTQLLVVGNSLIYEGVSRQAIQQSMGNSFSVHTAGVPGSTYQDWRYGLRALFQRGSRPDVVVFGISPSQFLRAPAVTSLPASQLWRVQEVFAYSKEQQPDLTTLSELLLEHSTTFFYMRDTMRIYTRKAIPGYEAMIDQWTKSTPQASMSIAKMELAEGVFAKRLSALQAECSFHAQLILIIVPTDQLEDEALEPALRSAAAKAGIDIVEPIHEREWPIGRFQSDGYHLTPPAATEFSRLAGADLEKLLNGASAALK